MEEMVIKCSKCGIIGTVVVVLLSWCESRFGSGGRARRQAQIFVVTSRLIAYRPNGQVMVDKRSHFCQGRHKITNLKHTVEFTTSGFGTHTAVELQTTSRFTGSGVGSRVPPVSSSCRGWEW
jgi:hypothetical protein